MTSQTATAGRLARGLVLLGAAWCVFQAAAQAQRPPNRAEARTLRTWALQWCQHNLAEVADSCVYGASEHVAAYRTRISTADPRYGWADITADGLSGLLVRRPRRTQARWRVVAEGGGGVSTCEAWEKSAPRRVVADLGLVGLRPGGGQATRCQPRTATTASGSSLPTVNTVFSDNSSLRAVRPTMMSTSQSGCATELSRLHWSTWNGHAARGSGFVRMPQAFVRDGVSCAVAYQQAPLHTVTVRLSGVVDCAGRAVFTRLVYTRRGSARRALRGPGC